MSYLRRRYFLAGLTLTPLWAASCGSDEPQPSLAAYAVEGQVVFQGKPTPLARIEFHPMGGSPEFQKYRPTAQADDEGRFQISTFGLRDGAPEGQYKVTVVWNGPDPGTDMQAINIDEFSYAPNRLDDKYAEADTTPLTARIGSGVNKLEPFHVD
jgi:hypothetical protein